MANEVRLIDANALLEKVQFRLPIDNQTAEVIAGCVNITRRLIENAPTVDAVEVVHGRWKPHYKTFDADMSVGILGWNYQTGWQCSVCGRYEPSKEPYCNCGAKMDGDGNGTA